MIIVGLKGGLGNQLFQYVFGRYLSMVNKCKVKFTIIKPAACETPRKFRLDNFNTCIKFATEEEVLGLRKTNIPLFKKIISKLFKKYNVGYQKISLDLKDTYMEGFWQTYKYSERIRNMLIPELTLKIPVEVKYQDLVFKICSHNSVSIHIRRGDYISDPKTNKMHSTIDIEYYKRAIKIIGEKIPEPAFFIFSDDIEWVKKNLKISSPTTFVSNPQMEDFEELILMSKCKNNIIANSSFSWWAAWLNQNPNKVVIAPKKWFNNIKINVDDLLPSDWIKI